MPWEVEYTDAFGEWWASLTADEQDRTAVAVGVLEEKGPGLGRPWVDTLEGSRHPHMKELRPRGGHLRILFAFDPRRTAIMLLGGDKSGEWTGWYERAIPEADRLDEEHLSELRDEGTLP